jgi:hypothetical protein
MFLVQQMTLYLLDFFGLGNKRRKQNSEGTKPSTKEKGKESRFVTHEKNQDLLIGKR